MPRLRFTRDQRGYEHTFLVHTTGRQGRERSRVLYWFRSPPAVRVGRPALDPTAIRTIEEANPGIAFDWPKILDARQAEAEPLDGWRAQRTRPNRQREARENPPAEIATASPGLSARLGTKARGEGEEQGKPGESPSEFPPSPFEVRDPEDDGDGDHIERSAVHRALGSEGLVRVRARYAEVLARISSQVTDAAVGDELRALAERLNPDAWVTDAEVRGGLENFEPVLETVRQRLGRPRRQRGQSRPDNPDHPHPPAD